jgi:hypothetical protein
MISEYDFIEEENHEIAQYFQLDMIEELLKTSIVSVEENEYIYKSLNGLTYKYAMDLIFYLQNKQVNRIHAGLNYNATYIKQFLKESI